MGKKSKGGCLGWLLVVIVAAAVGFGIFVVIKKKHAESNGGASPVPGPPGSVAKKYAEALKTAMKFLDVQKCMRISPFSHFLIIFAFLSFKSAIGCDVFEALNRYSVILV